MKIFRAISGIIEEIISVLKMEERRWTTVIEVCGNTRHAYLLTFLTVKMFPNNSWVLDRISSRNRRSSHNMKSSTGMQLLSDHEWDREFSLYRRIMFEFTVRRGRGFLDRLSIVSTQKILYRYAPVSRCGLTPRVKGKLVCVQHRQQRFMSIRDVRWIIAFRIG